MKNTVGKGEIACYGQFLLFQQCFQKTCTADQGLFGKGLIYTARKVKCETENQLNHVIMG